MAESPPPVEHLRAWSAARQRLSVPAEGPLAALRAVLGVYSSHPTAPLALLCRSTPFAAEAFSELEQQRLVLRLPGMRQSIFLLPTEYAPRILAVTRAPRAQQERRLAYAGLTWEDYAPFRARVLDLTQQPVTASALQQALAASLPGLDGVRLMTGVRLLTSEGVLLRLSGSLRSDSLLYVATEAWLGRPLEEADAAAALRWLAGAYLQSYGPARIADFAWWCGLSRRQASEALAAVATVSVGGGLLLPTADAEAFSRAEPLDPDLLTLLPKWDAYTMAYAPDGRARLVDEAHRLSAYSTAGVGTGGTSGDGLPLVLRGGRAVATWAHRFSGTRMQVTVTPFAGEAPPPITDATCAPIAALLGASSVAVDPGTLR